MSRVIKLSIYRGENLPPKIPNYKAIYKVYNSIYNWKGPTLYPNKKDYCSIEQCQQHKGASANGQIRIPSFGISTKFTVTIQPLIHVFV